MRCRHVASNRQGGVTPAEKSRIREGRGELTHVAGNSAISEGAQLVINAAARGCGAGTQRLAALEAILPIRQQSTHNARGARGTEAVSLWH